jgi:riboflavin transporter
MTGLRAAFHSANLAVAPLQLRFASSKSTTHYHHIRKRDCLNHHLKTEERIMQATKKYFTTQRMTTIAILTAISIVLFLPPMQIPIVAFYKLDFSNLPVLLGTFAMGPLAGTIILLLKSLSGLLHSSSLLVGEIADFLVGLAMILPAGLIYKKQKSRKTAIQGMAIGSVVATIAGMLLNAFLLFPVYAWAYHMPVSGIVDMGHEIVPSIDSVWKMVFIITGPFNVLKWAAISVVGGLIYKPLSPFLHGKRNMTKP